MSALVESIGRKVVGIGINEMCPEVEGEFDWSVLTAKVAQLKQQGLNPVALYVIPDFNNPLAYHFSLEQRQQLLATCQQCQLEIIEDSPYGRFDYGGNERQPSLRKLDHHQQVYYAGSFAKTFCPGLRIGFLLIPSQQPEATAKLKALKSQISVNTSGWSQAVIGGFLLSQNYSLNQHLQPVISQYGKQRNALERALVNHLGSLTGVSWMVPQGGFFARVDLPFSVSANDVFECAKDHGVLFMPISFFCLDPQPWQQAIRLSFSYYSQPKLELAVQRLAQWIEAKINQPVKKSTSRIK
jgi:(S)-3,5-dihydroxyphenylglycine transaminase